MARAGLRSPSRRVFACGADVKGRFSLFDGERLHLSEAYGDLSDPGRLAAFLLAAREMAGGLGISPGIVAHDMHPGYYSRIAAGLFPNARRLPVQHHHAHVGAALAGRGRDEEVIGVAFDGAGYGTDGTIWGGEFLSVSPRGWERCGHLACLRMPGGEIASREPWRMGLSLLYSVEGEAAFEAAVPFVRRAAASRPALAAMLGRGVSSPLASSCGRLFDAVAALLGIAPETQGEAEAAIELERRASISDDAYAYPFRISAHSGGFEAGYAELVRTMKADIRREVPVETVARRFHNGLAACVAKGAELIRRAHGCGAVALCGGAFENRLLRREASRMLGGAGFELIEDACIPNDDLGICVGQTWVALHAGG